MAGAGHKDFTSTILTASDVNTYLMQQTVMVFATSTARSTALPVPTEGMVSFLKDSNTFWYHDGSAWVNLGNVMPFTNSTSRGTLVPSPTEGMLSWLQDVDELEVYNGTSWSRIVVTAEDESVSISGDLTVDTTTLKVDAANNRVGVGTASPFLTTHIYAGASGNTYNAYTTHLRIENNGNTGISMHTPTANDAAIGHATPLDGASSAIVFDGANRALRFATVNGTTRMTINNAGAITKPYQPYVQARGNGGVWVNPWGANATIRNNFNGTAFTWSMAKNVGSHFSPSSGYFTAPVDGVYLCIFKTYQQNYGSNGYIHWMFNVGGTAAWNNGSLPYNIYGYDRTTYAEGVDVAAMIHIGAGNGVGIEGHYGGDERFYSDYTYFAVYLLG